MKGFPVIDMAATGENILRLRKESGLSVAQLQEFFGFDAPQAIYKWQRGETLPSTDNLVALSYLLGVPIDEILIRKKAMENATPQEDSCGGPFSLVQMRHLLILKIVVFSILEAIKIIHMILEKINFIVITIYVERIVAFRNICRFASGKTIKYKSVGHYKKASIPELLLSSLYAIG